jgi:hypothetical protein
VARRNAGAKINAALIEFPMHCHSVGCGMSNRMTRIDYAKFYSRSHDAVIRVYDEAGNIIETHEHKGDFKEP